MKMLERLNQIERELPDLLRDESKWNSLFVDYHPLTVERLWREMGDYRVCLHKIHPCKPEEALFHPHSWPSTMKLLAGRYDIGIGYGIGEQEPPIATRIIMVKGSIYEMSEKHGWHYVAPIDNPVFSLMVTGKPWERRSPRSEKKLSELTMEQKRELFEFFRKAYELGGKNE
jgi:hypothetical protein